MISFTHKGDLSKTTGFLKKAHSLNVSRILHKYGAEGVAALASATPLQSGKTASSWDYEIESSRDMSKITFINTHVNKGVQIAIILQTGHGTGTGGWVQGRDYINPAIQPIFDKIADAAWREVTTS
jgi:hypothetical protein